MQSEVVVLKDRVRELESAINEFLDAIDRNEWPTCDRLEKLVSRQQVAA